MRYWVGYIGLGVVLGMSATGCGPNVPKSELGNVVFEVPTVAGADEPYKLPDMPPLPPGHPKRSHAMPNMGSMMQPPVPGSTQSPPAPAK